MKLGEATQEQLESWKKQFPGFSTYEVSVGKEKAMAYFKPITKEVLMVSTMHKETGDEIEMSKTIIVNLWIGGYEPLKDPKTNKEEIASVHLGKIVRGHMIKASLPQAEVSEENDITTIKILLGEGKEAVCRISVPGVKTYAKAMTLHEEGRMLEGGLRILHDAWIDGNEIFKNPQNREEEMAQCKAGFMAWFAVPLPEVELKKNN